MIFRRFGPPEQVLNLEEEDLPPLAPDSLRVRMIAAPINPSDLIPITGAYAYRVRPPRAAGYEGVGQVVETGRERRAWLGRRVLPLRGDGTWQTVLDCAASRAVPVPDSLPFDQAARAYINPLTASALLKNTHVSGLRVMLTAAGSEMTMLLAHQARAAGTAALTGIYRSHGRKACLETWGMHPIHLDDVDEIARAAVSTDLVFDAVGGRLADLILTHLPARARFVSYGLLSGHPIKRQDLPVRPARFHLRDHIATLSDQDWLRGFAPIWPMLRDSPLGPVTTFPMQRWREALDYAATPGRATKPLLTFNDDG
ncbi:zinc-dependent alcohol dehydrogenase family protein [Xaviernesmea oryzae]|uniref:zinc-dependent alcohol dehydrogenase family protein n=1 Tax=Xaviernesmea oryzae TaxID=464029 RepID=UPI001AEC90FB|nr:zinc-dependent alcohol dehydrogenase family protein [Xaviernesmea oryzae]